MISEKILYVISVNIENKRKQIDEIFVVDA